MYHMEVSLSATHRTVCIICWRRYQSIIKHPLMCALSCARRSVRPAHVAYAMRRGASINTVVGECIDHRNACTHADTRAHIHAGRELKKEVRRCVQKEELGKRRR